MWIEVCRSIGYVFVSMKNGLRNRIEECCSFMECAQQTIITVGKECLNRQNGESRRVIDECRKMEKELGQRVQELEKLGGEQKKKEMEIEQGLTLNYIVQIQQEASSDKKLKQQARYGGGGLW